MERRSDAGALYTHPYTPRNAVMDFPVLLFFSFLSVLSLVHGCQKGV